MFYQNRKDGKDGWFAPRGPNACKRVESFSDDDVAKLGLTADNIVFSFQMPHPRDNMDIDFSRSADDCTNLGHFLSDFFTEKPMGTL